MAIDKAIDSSKLDREMLATANAIREKGKTAAAIPWEDETGYAAPILALKGGADLNFSVVAYASEDELPETADENTIAVITSNEITSWAFSATEPENPQTGMVWFKVGTTSSTEFNALKENGIQVYPLYAKQYNGSTWVDMPAKSYQGGKWVEWWDGTLYDAGNEYVHITGGIAADSTTGLTKNATTFNIGFVGSVTGDTGVYTAKPIDITGFKTLYVTIDRVNFANNCACHMRIFKDGVEVSALNTIREAKTF